MNRNKGMAGIYTGIVLSALGVLAMALPFAAGADMTAWGYGTVAVGFLVLAAGVTTLLLYLHRRKILRRMMEGREALARWTYDAAYWRAAQMDEVRSNKGMPVFGAILGGIFLIIGLVFYLTDPDDMGLMLAAMAGIGLLIAGVAWLSTVLRNRAILKSPGEVVIARGGVYYQGYLTDWNAVTSVFELAKVQKTKKHARLVITYRQLAGRYARFQNAQIAIPIPEGREAEAEAVANKLNAQPY